MEKLQIASSIFLNNLETMKATLSLLEFKLGKTTEDYIFAKSQIMDFFYNNLKKLFKKLEENKIIKRCDCKANLRCGFKKCIKCSGSGYCNY